MSQAEELLNSITESSEPEVVAEIDTRNFFMIDPDTRTIRKPSGFVALGVESDEETERIWFMCPRIVGDNVDLSTYVCAINYENAAHEEDRYIVDDLTIDGDYIIFSWGLRRKVTRVKGNVSFNFCATITDPNTGEILNEWNTTPCVAPVLEGKEVGDPEPGTPEYDYIVRLSEQFSDTMHEIDVALDEIIELQEEILVPNGDGVKY